MKCSKCNGLMAFESFEDFLGTPKCSLIAGWRCLSCGNISDPMIEIHKKNGPALIPSKKKKGS